VRPPGRESRPREGAALEINAGQAVDTSTLLYPDEVARHVDGCFVAVVETPSGTYRRRVFLTLNAAERAVDNARARGCGARIVLAELKPLYLVEAGQLQPVLSEVAS